jgi:hypothetical protein
MNTGYLFQLITTNWVNSYAIVLALAYITLPTPGGQLASPTS